MTRTATRLVLAAALAGATYATGTATASEPPCPGYITPYSINVPGYANCMIDRVANCTAGYDPLSPPFGQQVAPETVEYVGCLG